MKPLSPSATARSRSRKRIACQFMAFLMFVGCVGNYWHLSRHQHQRDRQGVDAATEAAMQFPVVEKETQPPTQIQIQQTLQPTTSTTEVKRRDVQETVARREPVEEIIVIEEEPAKTSLQNPIPYKTIVFPSGLLTNKEALAIFNYSPNRIPGYISVANDTIVLYGHVMRELTRRICARQIAQSNILVVSEEAPAVAKLLDGAEITNDNQEGTFRKLIHYKVGGCTLIHAHRQGHIYHGLDATTSLNNWQDPPGWILLAMFDHPEKNDEIISNAIQFLKQSTVTYIVVGIGANAKTNTLFGKEAISHLLNLNYKVQILSQSHIPTQISRHRMMAPNSDITNLSLYWVFDSMMRTSKASGRPVYGYVFATQGLDLAIPTGTAYEPKITNLGVKYKQCPESNLDVQFTPHVAVTRTGQGIKRPEYVVMCDGLRTRIHNTSDPNSFWISGNAVNTSEAMCIRSRCSGAGPPKASCTTRILPKNHWNENESSKESTGTDEKPNLLLLMLDPISRARFERSLPKTNKLIQRLNFTSFQLHTAVGNNSGPNQAALYSGMPLASRQSISTHNQQGTEWLWDTLRQNGYATFKAEDGCVENSNMIQSINPQVDHGDALLEMMCFDFRRPNCIGNTPAAQHLIHYATQFIETYEERNQPWAAFLHFIDSHEDTQILEGTLDDPLFQFLYEFFYVEHCRTSVSSDAHCSLFDNTMIVLLSDHGLHYGSYLLSPDGLKERSKPMLNLKLPKRNADENAKAALEVNRKLHTTPFDVYQTLLEVLAPEARTAIKEPTGASLLEPLPPNRGDCFTTDGIPSYVCDILKGDPSELQTLMPGPPSVMSFYADIPAQNKVTRPICDSKADNSTIFTKEGQSCLCATSHRDWQYCRQHPWSKVTNDTQQEYFSMVDCDDSRSFEIQVQRDPKIVNRPEIVEMQRKTAPETQNPNILFLEVDSVSYAYADRHLPKTRELLKSLRLEESNSDPSGFRCQTGEKLCSAEFERVSVVGPSSIPNQLAVFGACLVTVGPERCEELIVDAANRTICTNHTSPVYGMELIARLRTSATFCPIDEAGRSPWIFDIAKEAGYVTLFAEEFCYEGSIFVPQGNIFPLNVDFEPGKFFCRAADLRAKREGIAKRGRPAWLYAYQSKNGEPNCVHKNGGYDTALVALDHVESMWGSYRDIPKLAYVNAIAAHEYADFSFMAEKAETYDLILSSFLERMLASPDASNTIIVVRSDHGLQAGPMTSSYDIQIEALRPWTEVIVPKSLPALSLRKLYDNQQKMVTGFDFYKTLTAIIVGANNEIMPDPPVWSSHLWQEDVPENRLCSDVKISNDYCLFEGQRTFSSPNLRSCNLVEDDQQMVCPAKAEEFLDSMSEIVDKAFYTTNTFQKRVCPRNGTGTTEISSSLTETWKQLDEAASQRRQPEPEVISAPPPARQVAMLTSMVSDLSDAVLKAENRSLNVCQTGFGQGHSAAMFLEASPNVKLQLLARLNHTTQTPLLSQLQSIGGNFKRMKHHKCDSCLAMLEFERQKGMQCDFLHGLASSSKRYAETIVDMVRKAPCGVILSSVATRSLRDPNVYFGTTNQWEILRAEGCIDDIHCFYDDNIPSNRFCMALTTGNCQVSDQEEAGGKCGSKIAELTKRIVLSQVCPLHELPIPMPMKSVSSKLATPKRVSKLIAQKPNIVTNLGQKPKGSSTKA